MPLTASITVVVSILKPGPIEMYVPSLAKSVSPIVNTFLAQYTF